MKNKLQNIFFNHKQTIFHLVIISIFILFAYSNIFQNNFLGDDRNQMQNWNQIKDLRNIPRFFWDQPPNSYSFYRPVGNMFVALNYHFWGSNTLGYHLVQLGLHIFNALLVYGIVLAIVKKTSIAFISSLIFGIHPLTAEAISFMLSSITLSYTFFLSSFFALLKKKYFLSILIAFLAFFSYELTLSLPLIILFYEICFQRKTLRKSIQISVPYFILAFLYIAMRYFILHVPEVVLYPGNSFYLTMLLTTKIITQYIFLLVFPLNLSINHLINPGIQSLRNPYTESLDMGKVLSQNIFDKDIVLSLVIISALIILCILSIKKAPIIAFCIGWFLITLLPSLNLVPQTSIMQERYAYLPSFSYGLIIALGLEKIARYIAYKIIKAKTFGLIVICILLPVSLLYGIRTYLRNNDWKNDLSMWSNLASQLPNDGATNFYLGTLYANSNNDAMALKYYQKTLMISPNVADVYYHIGKIYQKHGLIKEALTMFKQTLIVYPEFTAAQDAIKQLQSNQK